MPTVDAVVIVLPQVQAVAQAARLTHRADQVAQVTTVQEQVRSFALVKIQLI